MSAINLYNTKTEALYFKDSQINQFYEFGGIQLLPNATYTQKSKGIKLSDGYTASAYSVYDDSFLGAMSITNIQEEVDGDEYYANFTSIYANSTVISVTIRAYWSITSTFDFGTELVYLKFTNGVNTYYSNPFFITALDEDKTTTFTYKDLASSKYQSIGLKTWFRQKSRQSELTTYYESSTKNTVTQSIKTNNLEMYESELMCIEDLILTAQIVESPYLYIGSKRYSLFEAVKIPELTNQENFGKIKFTLAPNN